MLNNLEATIEKIILDAAATMARQIAHSVRRSLAEEIIGTGGKAAATPATPKRMGRPPGSKSKVQAAAVTTAPAPTKTAAAKPVKAKRKSYKRRSITQGELDAVMSVLAKKPGLTSVQIQREAGIDAKQAGRVLGKLRQTDKVKWKGERSAAAYSVA